MMIVLQATRRAERPTERKPHVGKDHRVSTEISTTEYAHDEVSGARMINGHMITTSDLDTLTAPRAIGAALQPLLADPAHRVLLAGPRAALLVSSVPRAQRVDVLVRGLHDVRRIGEMAELREGVRLFCGAADAFQPDDSYDLVIALGGPERLLGPDSRGMGVDELIGRLTGFVREGGHLVVDIANELGLDDLVSGRPDPSLSSDERWHVGALGFDSRHLYPNERASVLDRHGLVPVVSFSALPSLDASRVLLRTEALDTPDLRGRAANSSGHALDSLLADGPVLRDPRPTLTRVVEAGMLDELAPAWLLVGQRGQGTASATADDFPILAEAELESRWQVFDTIDAAGTERRSWADGSGDDERSEGTLVRSLRTETSLGRSLEVTMRDACAQRNHAAVRREVGRYATWLRRDSAWDGRTSSRVFATPANVLVDENGDLQLIDGSWRLTSTVSANEALVCGLRDFADRLLASAAVHPWRTAATPDELTVTLAAMVGLTVTRSTITRVAGIEGEIEALRQGAPEQVDELTQDNLDRGRFGRNLPVRDEIGFRELLGRDRAQASALREKEVQVAWLEGTLRHRDHYIRRLERIIESYEQTLTYRTVAAIRTPRRVATAKAVSVAKSTVNDVLPPDTVSRARRFAAKVLR